MSQTNRTVTAADDERRAIYASYVEYCNTHDFDAMETFYTTPTLNVNDEAWTPRQVTDQFRPIVEAFPDWHWEIRHLTIDGDFLSLHFRVTGTHKGTFRGIEATGRRIDTTQFTLYQLEGNKYSNVWDLVDFDTIVKQIS